MFENISPISGPVNVLAQNSQLQIYIAKKARAEFNHILDYNLFIWFAINLVGSLTSCALFVSKKKSKNAGERFVISKQKIVADRHQKCFKARLKNGTEQRYTQHKTDKICTKCKVHVFKPAEEIIRCVLIV